MTILKRCQETRDFLPSRLPFHLKDQPKDISREKKLGQPHPPKGRRKKEFASLKLGGVLLVPSSKLATNSDALVTNSDAFVSDALCY